MFKLLAVFLGGGAGSSLRWLVNSAVCRCTNGVFPAAGTFLVNIIGSFILGFLFYHFLNKANVNEELRLLLTAGFCGGFTTLSAFALENYLYIQEGEIIKSLVYITATVISTVLALALGVYLAKQF